MQKNNQLITEILSKNLKCVFISPHLDDAVLSCGGLMMELAHKTELEVINIFTAAHEGPYTLSARKFLRDSGQFVSATELYEARRKEDEQALRQVGARVVNLGLEDALFRRKPKKNILGRLLPEFKYVYPTYKWHITKSVNSNDPAIKALREKLKQIKQENAVVFAPLAIGGHVDHQLVNMVSQAIFDNLVLYSDFPYNVRTGEYGTVGTHHDKFTLAPDLEAKIELIKIYETQFAGLFEGSRVPVHKEHFFRKTS